jgi:CheY-like chemotaxis protein
MKHCDILIIDDDKDDIQMLSEALSEYGVQHVHHVDSVPEAYKYLKAVHPKCIPRLIITDLFLPMIKGDEFLKEMKSSLYYKDVPVVIITTSRLDSEYARLIELGASDFIAKPLNSAQYMQLACEMKTKAGL